MKKLLAVAIVYILLFSGNISFRSNSDTGDIDHLTTAKISQYTASKKDNTSSDSAANYRLQLMKHSVKIRENVTITDITGFVLDVDDASSGSGAVVAINEETGKSLIITAEHVCSNAYDVGDIISGKYKILSTEKEIVTYDGTLVKTRIIYKDVSNDVCVMEADAIVGDVVEIASFFPPTGATITSSGAPAGYWEKGLSNVVEGIFIGFNPESICVPGRCFSNMLQFSLPIVGGMSGSGVYYKGKLFALVTIGTGQYEHIGWGPGLVPIKAAFDKAYALWAGDEI